MLRRFAIMLGLVTLLGLIGVAAAVTPEDDCYAANAQWDMEESKCIVQTGIRIDLDYPIELAEQPVVADTIGSWFAETQTSFIASYVPDFTLPSYVNNWTLTASYALYRHSDSVSSLVYTVGNYTGGAHPNYVFTTFTFDFETQQQVSLEYFFQDAFVPWATIGPLVDADLAAQLGEAADASWIEQGSGGNPDNYGAFALTEDSLVFFFAPYQVAAYAFGGLQVAIPLDALAEWLKPEFMPAR